MINQHGFTLIEALAAGLISTIVAGALLSVLYLSTGQIKEGTAHNRLLSLQAVVSEQIRTSTRNSKTVKRSSEFGTTYDILAASPLAYIGLKEIWLFNRDGDTLAAYQVRADQPYLYEWKAGAFQIFQVGNETVNVDYGQTEFGILPNRHGITFKIGHTKTEGAVTYAIPVHTDTILTRDR